MAKASRAAARDLAALPAHAWLPEPELAFHPERLDYRSNHPLVGLLQYGPFGDAMLNRIISPIRVAMLAPAGGLQRLDELLRELDSEHQPRERKQYLQPYPGFARTFRIGLASASGHVRFELSKAFDDDIARSARPHVLLADRLTREIGHIARNRSEFDVLLIYLPSQWSGGFTGGEVDDFDLHDYLKAITAIQDIPIQIVNDDRPDSALNYFCRCSVMWRLAIALYCKAGGVPWKLADASPGTAYIGISYALKPNPADGKQFVTCCSQVFDAEGTGLEFLAYTPEPDQIRVEHGENPFLSRAEMRRVMARSLQLYQRRHGGAIPQRVVVHKTTEFKIEETDGCFDALRASEGIELLQVQQDTPWRGMLIEPPRRPFEKKGQVAGYPLYRGSYMPLGTREILLWTQGDVPSATGGAHYYKEGKGIPSPLLIRRFAGHGGWETTSRDILGLTKMDWNNDSLYSRLPVTLGFAQTLAKVIRRMDRLGDRAFSFRLFM